MRFIAKWKLYTAAVDGCATGLADKDGRPIKKPWQFITSCQRQAVSLSMLRCAHGPDFKHVLAEGSSTTKSTEVYPVPLCRTLLGSLFGGHGFAPAMPCTPFDPHTHRQYERLLEGFAVEDKGPAPFGKSLVPGAVTRLMSRAEVAKDPDAQAAIRKEARSLEEVGTWDLSTVADKKDLEAWAKQRGPTS